MDSLESKDLCSKCGKVILTVEEKEKAGEEVRYCSCNKLGMRILEAQVVLNVVGDGNGIEYKDPCKDDSD